MTKHAYPEFHKALLDGMTYPEAPRRVRFTETRRSWLYRTGTAVYKIRKASVLYSSPAIMERYAQRALVLGRHWAGPVMQAVVPLTRCDGGFRLDGAGEPVAYALRMAQLPESHWLERLLAHGKLTPTEVGRLARFVAERHAAAALAEPAAEAGQPDRVLALFEELIYESRNFASQTVGAAVMDRIAHPMEHYLEQHRRTFVRRVRRGRIVEGHGALVPEHIFAHGTDLHALAPLEAQPKYRVLDAANDVALLVNALTLRAATEPAELFVKRYASAARDRELTRVLPVYRVLQAVRAGLTRSQWVRECALGDDERQALVQEANACYELALRCARELPSLA